MLFPWPTFVLKIPVM